MKMKLSSLVGIVFSGLGSISAFALIASQDAIPGSIKTSTFGGECLRCEANQKDCPSNNLAPGSICTPELGESGLPKTIKKCDGTAGKGKVANTQQKATPDPQEKMMKCPMGVVYECWISHKEGGNWVYTWQDGGQREQCDEYSFCNQTGLEPCPPTPPGTGE